MDKIKNVLIVDDSAMNRSILCEILSPEYKVTEAENGVQALDKLRCSTYKTDAIILDIIMPEMGGYEFMEHLKQDKRFSQIPVIILTEKSDCESERKALESGAWDFVSKPYDAEIVKLRLKNVIARSQMTLLKELNHVMNYDPLTGVYSKNKFFSASKTLLTANPDKEFAFIRLDIDRFKLINSFFGNSGGDKLLKYMAKRIREFAATTKCCTFGRIDADVFGVFTPYQGLERTAKILERSANEMKSITPNYNIMVVFGVYVVTDRELPISHMCDRAALAARTVKGHYMQCYAFYDENMQTALEREQNIIIVMEAALENNEFTPYYQPKYDIKTNMPVGAEALARWIHPTKGFVSPGVFIPVFEKNGFISKLDFYIWECVCKQLKEWKDKGIPLFPVSVNVSRVNLYNPNLTNIIVELTKKYGVDPKYFNIEITESVYTDENIMIDDVTNQLRSHGFTILMDDFGSGYSSLNVLKDVKVDVLKMDMKFMFKAKYEGRAETIISSVIRMAKWLNIPVIAEGVDQKEQVEFLRSVGCDFIQGFYFARPMPAKDYEKLISEQKEFEPAGRSESINDILWGKTDGLSSSVDDSDQPALVLECFKNGITEAVTGNKAFTAKYGFDSNMYGKFNVINCIDNDYKELYTSTINKVIESKGRAECVFSMHDINGKKLWFSSHFRYVSETDVSTVVITYLTDVTNLMFMDQRISDYKNYLRNEVERRHNVLIISENSDTAQKLSDILSEDNCVFTANSLGDGRKLLSENNIELLCFDAELMDENDIFPLGDEIGSMPVIAIASSREEIKRRAFLEERISDFVLKPFIPRLVRIRTANPIKLGIAHAANEKYFSQLK